MKKLRKSVWSGIPVVLGIIFCLSPLVSFAETAYKDRITLKDKPGEPIVGTIIKEDADGVSLSNGQMYGWAKIDRIDYDPISSQALQKALSIKSYEQAAQAFQKIADDLSKYRDILQPQILYGLAWNLQKSGKDYTKAAAAYDKLLNTFPDFKDRLKAIQNKIDCLVAAEDTKGALTAIAIAEPSVSGEFALKLKLQAAQIYESSKPPDLKSAKTAYDKVNQGAGGGRFPALVEIASVGLGRVILNEGTVGSAEEAEKIFKDITSKSTNETALAGAYAGLGDVYYQKAKKSDKMADYNEAIRNYLRTNVEYYPTTEDSFAWTNYINATLNAGRCLKKVANLVDEKKKPFYIELARLLFEEIKGIKWFPPNAIEEIDKEISNLNK